jgi:hypothetical protein
MRGQYEELNCPFCDKGKIQAWHIPSFWQEKRSVTATFGSRRNLKRTQDIWNIKSGCNICGKSQEEVEKKLKEEGFL